MIDRERVRELAYRRSPLANLRSFLDRSEPVAQMAAEVLPRVMAGDRSDGARIELLMERILGDGLIRFEDISPGRTASVLGHMSQDVFAGFLQATLEVARQCEFHARISLMRVRTGGRVSQERAELGARLIRLQQSLSETMSAMPRARTVSGPGGRENPRV